MMRVGAVTALCACTFSPPPANIDAPLDVGREIGNEDPPSARFRDDLIGFWTFDDASGSLVATDTATANRVDLTALDDARFTPPVFAGGRASAAVETLMLSAKSNHLPTDCTAANAVTLEAWIAPLTSDQGTSLEPVFIAGLAKSVTDRDVVLLQAGTQWLARVRTGAPAGTPDLVSTSAAEATTWTHLVVVADSAARTLYVNNQVEATTAGGSLSGWDTSVAMYLFEEPQRTRPWFGSMALVALYNRALTVEQIEQNFIAGPDSP